MGPGAGLYPDEITFLDLPGNFIFDELQVTKERQRLIKQFCPGESDLPHLRDAARNGFLRVREQLRTERVYGLTGVFLPAGLTDQRQRGAC